METKIESQWHGRKRLERRSKDLSDNASHKFQDLVDVALFDGYLSNSEAHMLVQEHNRLQEASRTALLKILKEHGYENLASRGVRRKRLSEPQREEFVDHFGKDAYGYWTDKGAYLPGESYSSELGSVHIEKKEDRRWIFPDDAVVPSNDVEYGATSGMGLRPRPGKRTRFFLIIAVPMIFVLLKLAGVF